MPEGDDYRKYLELQFEGLHKAMNAHAHDTHDRLDILNGSIKKNAIDISNLQKETTIIRWCSRNPGISSTIILVLIISAITICSVIGIEGIINLIK